MSKRFGRNQKRRLKAELAQARRYIEAEQKRNARTRDRLEHAEAVINDVANVLGPHFVGLEEDRQGNIELDHLMSGWAMVGYGPEVDFMPSFHDDMLSTTKATMYLLDMRRIGPVSVERDELRMMTHVFAAVGDQAVAYGVSDQALHKAPLPYMASLISQAMANEVLKALRKKA